MLCGIDNWLPAYSSHCRQCCLGPLRDGTCGTLSNSLEEAHTNWCHRSCIPNKLAAWTCDAGLPLHSLEGTRRCACFATVHSLDIKLYIIWLAGVPHGTSVLYAVGPSCPGTCDAVSKSCVVGPAELDMRQHIWLDKMLHNTAVSAVCRWTWSPLNVMLSRAVSVDSLERCSTLQVVILQVCDADITYSVSLDLTGKDKWPYNFGHALTDVVDVPLDLLKGHAMLYDGDSVSIAKTVIVYMQWRSCCLHHTGMWLACLSFSS